MNHAPEQFESVLRLACEWIAEQETVILKSGVPLTELQILDAQRIGVARPEAVRLRRVTEIPMPTHPVLAAMAIEANLISADTHGLTARFGIFIRHDYWQNRQLIAHELVHTKQYEQLGGFEGFLRPYLSECITPGYPDWPMEQEAIRTAAMLCSGSSSR